MAMTMMGPPVLKGRPPNLRRPINPSRELSYVDKMGASGVFFIGVFLFSKGFQLIDESFYSSHMVAVWFSFSSRVALLYTGGG